MLKVFFIGIFLFSGLFYGLLGQDMHYSQYYFSPINLNPAMTGVFHGDYRFTSNYRNQWATVSIPYESYTGALDFHIHKDSYYKLSTGILFNKDQAGDAHFGTTQIKSSFGLHLPVKGGSKQMLSLGIDLNYYQRNINFNNLYFDNQYTGEMYLAYLPTNEEFTHSKISYYDFGVGANWQYTYNEEKYYNVGFAISHINRPCISFLKEENVRLNIKYVFYTNNLFEIKPSLKIIPGLMVAFQGTYSELILGANLRYGGKSLRRIGDVSAFYIGPSFRFNPIPEYAKSFVDAFIINTKYDKDNFRIGMSYDINISGLIPASKGHGSLEFSLIYVLKNASKRNKKGMYLICPVFL